MNKVSAVKRMGVADAKAHLSDVLRTAEAEPVVIHSRGRDVAVVLGIAAYERLLAAEATAPSEMARLMADIAELRDKHGGGAEIPYRRIGTMRRNPFSSRKK